MPDKDKVSIDEVLKAGSWLGRNLPRLVDWVRFLGKKLKKTAPALALISIISCAPVVKFINSLPEIPPTPTPRPPVIISTPTPSHLPSLEPTAIPSASPTATPFPTSTPSPTATPFCIPKPSQEAISLANCTATDIELPFRDEITHIGPLCGLNYGQGNENTAWRLGYGLARQGMRVALVNGKRLQFNEGRGYTDKLGRYYPDGVNLYQHPEGETAPWTWGGYLVPPFCEDLPKPTPTPVGPTPIPNPRGDSCSCQVICTSEFLGWNRPGLPPNAVIGGQASIDITCRQAQFPGDQRGQPVDRSNGPDWCEPSENPVLWDINIPGGVEAKVGGDGYRLDLKNLQEGSYSIHVRPNPNARYRNGDPIQLCPWGHNSSVKDFVEFSL